MTVRTRTTTKATVGTTTKSSLPLARPAPSRRAPAVLCLLVALTLFGPSAADASNQSLKTAMATWSHRIAVDAHGISLSASQRHPRRMMLRAGRFRTDALRARRAMVAQRPSTARGRRARLLAMAAFRSYTIVGREWKLSGQARLQGKKRLAAGHAAFARRFAVKGNRLLVSSGRLLR